MKRELSLTALIVIAFTGIVFAQIAPMVQVPKCAKIWNCVKTLGTATACSCTNPTTNSMTPYIYSPSQVNSIKDSEDDSNVIVNTIINAQ